MVRRNSGRATNAAEQLLLLFRVDSLSYEQPEIVGMRTRVPPTRTQHASKAGGPAIFRHGLGGYRFLLWPIGWGNPPWLVVKTKNRSLGAWLFASARGRASLLGRRRLALAPWADVQPGALVGGAFADVGVAVGA